MGLAFEPPHVDGATGVAEVPHGGGDCLFLLMSPTGAENHHAKEPQSTAGWKSEEEPKNE